jgi:hypothetical protein
VDNVIVFPAKSVSDRAKIERAIRNSLGEAGASHDETEAIISSMKEFLKLLELDFVLSIPASVASVIDSQLSEFSAALKERTNQLMVERLKAEVAHVASRRGH